MLQAVSNIVIAARLILAAREAIRCVAVAISSFPDKDVDQLTRIDDQVFRLLKPENNRQDPDVHAFQLLVGELDFSGYMWLHPDEVERDLDIGPTDG